MNDGQNKEELLSEIEKTELQITCLNEYKRELACRLQNLSQEDIVEQQNLAVLSVSDKIRLFRSLFRGRDDVYARLWTSRKTGRSGYSPVCKNEWVSKICRKPTIKCANCSNREFLPLNDEVIYKHLSGEHIAGIYPMLKNENCRLLAVDFDGKSWMDDIVAFRQTCLDEEVPVAVERSRSGNGAHCWVFFKEEVSASFARKMGSFLITQTMSKRYQLDMKSYDRLFPNQDTLPKRGFGNLIALPLQKKAIKDGNSLFINENFNPYADQWAYLASIQKMSYKDVERIADEASSAGQIIGVRISPMEEDDLPWMRLPSGRKRYKTKMADLPESLELVVANRIYIKTEDVPSIFLNQLKQLAAFQNPEFYKRQNMRLSTFLTPRVICCAEIMDGYLSIPRGCLEEILYLMNEYGIEANVRDEQTEGTRAEFKFYGELKKGQKTASRKILKSDTGVFVSPPGTGKTVIAIHTIAKRRTNTLILVHRKPLMEQWRAQLSSYLGIDIKDIGQIGASKDKANGIIDVAMIQSMERKGVVDDKIANYGFIVVDECHHISAVTFERVLKEVKAKYILGLTATPYRKDGHQPIIHMQCGSIVHQIKHKEVDQEISHYYILPRMTKFSYDWSEDSKIYDLWPELIKNIDRNEMIICDIEKILEEGRFPIILTERIEHLMILAEMMKDKGIADNLAVLHGKISPRRRWAVLQELHNNPDHSRKILLSTGSYIGEGFDDPRLDTLFITMPVSFKGKIVQYAGRLHRQYKGKKDVRIYDYVDKNVSVLSRMYQKRLKTYSMMGYEVKEKLEILR